MTEAEWLAATDPTPMLEFVRGKVSDRKLRLFAAACCHHIWGCFTDERSRISVGVAERFADRLASRNDLEEAHRVASAVEDEQMDAAHPQGLDFSDDWSFEVCCDASAAASTALCSVSDYPIGMSADDYRRLQLTPHPPGSHSVYKEAQRAAANAASSLRYEEVQWTDNPVRAAAKAVEANWQVHVTHDIFGNPFRPIALAPSWLTTTVVALAEGIYDDRAFDRMRVLADALEDAGCSHEDILSHCRGDGPHVKGCWVVDLLTGRM